MNGRCFAILVLGCFLVSFSSAAEAQWMQGTWISPAYSHMSLSALAVNTQADSEDWMAAGSRWAYPNIGFTQTFWLWGSGTDLLFGQGPQGTSFANSFTDINFNRGGLFPYSTVGTYQPDFEVGPTGVLYDLPPVTLCATSGVSPRRVASDSLGNRYVVVVPGTPNDLIVYGVTPNAPGTPNLCQTRWMAALHGRNFAGISNGFRFVDVAIDSWGLYVLATSYDSMLNEWDAMVFRIEPTLGTLDWQAAYSEDIGGGRSVFGAKVLPIGDGGALITATNSSNELDSYMITTSFTYTGAWSGWVQREFAVRSTPPSVPLKPMKVMPKGMSKDNTSVYVVADRIDQGGTAKIDVLKYTGASVARYLYNNPSSNATAGGLLASNGTVLVSGLTGIPGSALFIKLSASPFQASGTLLVGSNLTSLDASAFRARTNGAPEGYILAKGTDANNIGHYYLHAAY